MSKPKEMTLRPQLHNINNGQCKNSLTIQDLNVGPSANVMILTHFVDIHPYFVACPLELILKA